METILFQLLKYHFHWKQFFHLVEIYFKRILHCGQWQRIFFLLETIFFHSYIFETIIVIRRRPIFLKILFLLVETVFFNFFKILVRMEAVFRSNGIVFVKPFGFIQSFLLLEDSILEFRRKPIFFDFSISNSGSSFSE